MGHLLGDVLSENPQIQGYLFDLPSVVEMGTRPETI